MGWFGFNHEDPPTYGLRQSHLTHAVEWSETLATGSWSSAGVTKQILSDNGTVLQVKASVPAGSIDRRFIRLKVQ